MRLPASSTVRETYMQAHEEILILTPLHCQKVWEGFADGVYSILKCTHLESFFHYISNLHQSINLTLDKESIGELTYLATLLQQIDEKIFVLVYTKPTHTNQYLNYSSLHQIT